MLCYFIIKTMNWNKKSVVAGMFPETAFTVYLSRVYWKLAGMTVKPMAEMSCSHNTGPRYTSLNSNTKPWLDLLIFVLSPLSRLSEAKGTSTASTSPRSSRRPCRSRANPNSSSPKERRPETCSVQVWSESPARGRYVKPDPAAQELPSACCRVFSCNETLILLFRQMVN